MAEKKPARPRGSKPVKPPTIDLKAQRVSSDDAAKKPGAGMAQPSAKPATGKPATEKADPKPQAVRSEEMHRHSASKSAGKTGAAGGRTFAAAAMNDPRFLGAGAAGALAALIAVFIVWLLLPAPPPAGAPGALAQHLDALESAQGKTAQQIAALDERIASGNGAADVDALRGELADARQSDSAAREALGQRIAALESGLSALRDSLAAIDAGSGGGDASAIAGRIAQLEAQIGEARAAADAAQAAAAQLDAKLAALAERVAAAGAGNGAGGARAAQALALAGLRDAVARGTPFAGELEAMKKLVPDAAALGELDEAAASGVATRRELAADFSARLPGILNAANKREEAGVLAQLLDNARAIVTVRPVGAISGDSPEALVARIETALADGDLPAALAEWQKLPSSARDAGDGFGQALVLKVRTDAAVDALARAVIAGAGAS